MRRPLAALVLGAVSLAGLMPAAGAGAAELPKLPFMSRKPVLKLACDVVRHDAAPAVACRWSSPSRPADAAPLTYLLHRGGGGAGRTVVYRGAETSFVDTSVVPGSNYGYKVEALNADGKAVARSRAVVVKVPEPAEHLRLSCAVVERADVRPARPAVACQWSASERPDLAAYRLVRADGLGWRHVVYRGRDTAFRDEKVRPGHTYRYLVQALDHRGDVIGLSDVEEVAVPPVGETDPPVKPVDPVAVPKPRPVDPTVKPVPVPAPKPEPRPEPKPELAPAPKPRPLPEPKPEPLPAPTPRPAPEPERQPAPLAEPKPAPAVARMKLACAPSRMATTDTADTTAKDPATVAPSGAVVVCEWAAPSELKVAGYQLWRAERPDGTKQVIFRSADATRYVDRAVSAGHGYVYVVRALDAGGRVIAQSDAVSVSFPA